MTVNPVTAAHVPSRDQARRATVPVGVATLLIATVLSFEGRNSNGEFVYEIGLQVLAACLLFGVVVPRGLRHQSAGGRALVMGALGLLMLAPAFWLGLPVQLGAAAVLLGYAGRGAAKGSGTSITALVLGALTVIAYLSLYAVDYVDVHGLG